MGGVLNPINFVTGTLGSGKSYYAMKHIFAYLVEGKTIAANFDLHGDWWNTIVKMRRGSRRLSPEERYLAGSEVRQRALRFDTFSDLYDYRLPGEGEDRGLLVLDEGGLNLNRKTARSRQKRDEFEHDNELASFQFFINMRKLGWTLLILAHSAKHLDDQVQDLGGSIIRLRNFARVKMPLVGVSLTKHPRFLAIHYWPEVRAITKRELYGLKIPIARHYRSMDLFDYMPESEGLRQQAKARRLARPPIGTHPDDLGRIGGPRSPGAPGAERGRDAAAGADAAPPVGLDAFLAGTGST